MYLAGDIMKGHSQKIECVSGYGTEEDKGR